MPSASRYFVAFADGIATAGSAQNSSAVNVPAVAAIQGVTGFVKFVKGSLTNIIVKLQATIDGTTWYDLVTSATLTADGNICLTATCFGAKQVRASYTATGTATSSSIGVNIAWQQY